MGGGRVRLDRSEERVEAAHRLPGVEQRRRADGRDRVNPIPAQVRPTLLRLLPLAAGLFSGKILSFSDTSTSTSPRWAQPQSASLLQQKYAGVLPLLKPLKEALDEQGIAMPKAGHRWLQHHSMLAEGDGVVVGPSNVLQLDTNIKYCEKGPLPDDVLAILDEAWAKAEGAAGHYAL